MQQIKRVFSVSSERVVGPVERIGAPSLVREAVREAERATHRLRVERDLETTRQKRCAAELEALCRRGAAVPADGRLAPAKDRTQTAGAAVAPPTASDTQEVRLERALAAHADRIAALDRAIAAAVSRTRFLSEPEAFIREQPSEASA